MWLRHRYGYGYLNKPKDLAFGRAGRAHFVKLKVCPPVVPHTGLMPWVAIEVPAKPGYGSLAKYHNLAGPWCG